MNVKIAKRNIDRIDRTIKEINDFTEIHPELSEEMGFLGNAAAFLDDYRNVLENAIEKAELPL